MATVLRYLLTLTASVALASGPALAASGNPATATGRANAAVIAPIGISNVSALRFGAFVKPTTAGTLTVSTAGVATAAGGVVGMNTIAQTTGGPGAAQFLIILQPNINFTVQIPASISLSSGSQSMTVTNLATALQTISTFRGLRTYSLRIGGRLNVAANQAIGTYSGTYSVTAVYQ